MQVILRQDVPHLGRAGDLVKVRPGYGRNRLLPTGLAVVADSRNVKQLDHQKRLIAQRERKIMASATAIKDKLASLSLSISKQTGESDKLYGSVTTREIAAALSQQGVEIDRKQIELTQPIRALGVHEVTVRLAGGVSANLKIWVVAAEQ